MNSPQVLCINPWIYDFTAYDLWSKPLGLLYIAGILRQKGIAVDFVDCLDKWHPELLKRENREKPKLRKYGTGHFHREIVEKPECLKFVPRYFARYGLPEDIFRKELQSRTKPDLILVTSFMTYWYLGPKRVIEICREIFPKVPVVLGGIYATLLPKHAQSVLKPDFLMQGAGERKILELIGELFSVPHITENFPAHFDAYPFPAFDLLRKNDYLVVLTSRGCPFRCSFCATSKLEPTFLQRSPQNVVQEILQQTRRFGVQDVAFYDDALLFKRESHIKPILRGIIKSGEKLRFHTPNGLHGRYIDVELAELMKESGFQTLRISLESIDKKRKADIDHKIIPEQMERAVKNLVDAGFSAEEIETYVIMGLPEQPIEEVMETILYARSLGLQVRLASFSPIPGTKDHDRAVEKGYFPASADPLLTNKTAIPMFRTKEAYYRFHELRQLTKKLL